MPGKRHDYTNKEYRTLIRDNKLSGKFLDKYGENYTRAKTDDLAKFCNRYIIRKKQKEAEEKNKKKEKKKKEAKSEVDWDPIKTIKDGEKEEKKEEKNEDDGWGEDGDIFGLDGPAVELKVNKPPNPEKEKELEVINIEQPSIPKEEKIFEKEVEVEDESFHGIPFYDLSSIQVQGTVNDPEIKAFKEISKETGQPVNNVTVPRNVKYKKNDEAEKKINLYFSRFPNISEECKDLTFKSSDEKLTYIQSRLGTKGANDIMKDTFMRVLQAAEHMPYIDEYVYLDGFGDAIHQQRDTIGSLIDEIMCAYADDMEGFMNLAPEYRLGLVVLGTAFSVHNANIPIKRNESAKRILENQKFMEEMKKKKESEESKNRLEFEKKQREQQLEILRKKQELEKKKKEQQENDAKNMKSKLDVKPIQQKTNQVISDNIDDIINVR